jgi:glycosyltransferase involved in cell wall biosynthesis
MDKFKLSIITINYNDCTGLEKTIQSVIQQDVSNIQYIVIDGGSTDGSALLLDKYKEWIDVGISEKDKGIYNAMNKGAKFAKGEYLMFLNSGDELYKKEVMSKVIPLLKEHDIICGSTLTYSDNGSYLQIPPKNVSLFTFTGGSLPHPSSFIRRALFERIGGYREEYRIISDWCFFIEALIIDNCTYTTIPITTSKFNRYGISSTSSALESEQTQKFLREKFGRIMDDYFYLNNEALANTLFWISGKRDLLGRILCIFPKAINSIFKLRKKNGRRIISIKQ